ncbi:MAG: hypothetical protein OXI96_05430 [Acidimicrobiaceae bacterium]|nr:hypothetical protein [Acidimicrobiaceae bacterium]
MTNTKSISAAPEELVTFALDATRKAGALTLRWFQQNKLKVSTKTDGTPVTEADLAAEHCLRELIESRYPEDGIFGEEKGDTPGKSGNTWVIDPIDGTKAFVQGVPLYSTLLALVDQKGPLLGVIFLPALDECVWAFRGQGAYWDDKLCQVSNRKSLKGGGFVCTSGFSYWPKNTLNSVRQTGARIRSWGDAYGYALVATGRAEAMIDPECAPWDVAPVAVILEEAGGRFSSVTGVDDWQNGSALGSNGFVHEELLECFSQNTR